MSSTNRSEARQFHISDYYITPVNEIENFFAALDNTVTIDMDKCTLDPASGGDSENPMSYPTAIATIIMCRLKILELLILEKTA